MGGMLGNFRFDPRNIFDITCASFAAGIQRPEGVAGLSDAATDYTSCLAIVSGVKTTASFPGSKSQPSDLNPATQAAQAMAIESSDFELNMAIVHKIPQTQARSTSDG